MASSNSLAGQVLDHLASKHLHPSQAWLHEFLSSQRPNTPLPALKQTALFRLLASDFTLSLQSHSDSVFPPDVSNGQIKERTISGPVAVQVLAVQDLGSSKWSQIEALESAERGETTKGREIIRTIGEDGQAEVNPPTSTGPFKLLLQDAAGTQAYGFELIRVGTIGVNLPIGSKLVLRDFIVARGVILLEPNCVTFLGGKIEALQPPDTLKVRKQELKNQLGVAE